MAVTIRDLKRLGRHHYGAGGVSRDNGRRCAALETRGIPSSIEITVGSDVDQIVLLLRSRTF